MHNASLFYVKYELNVCTIMHKELFSSNLIKIKVVITHSLPSYALKNNIFNKTRHFTIRVDSPDCVVLVSVPIKHVSVELERLPDVPLHH